MPEHSVDVVARGGHPPARPFDIVKTLLAREPAVITIGAHEWHHESHTMSVVVEARDETTARVIVESAVVRNGDVWRRFAYSLRSLVTTPQAW